MVYTVVWSRAARNQLTDLWIGAADRTAVALASHEIDRTLRDDPHTKGFPYSGGRVLTVPPLWARFVVRPDDMMAEVIEVR